MLFLFNTVLNKQLYIANICFIVYIYIFFTEFLKVKFIIYKKNSLKFTYTWFLNLCHYLHDPQLFFMFCDSFSWVPWLSWDADSTIYLRLKCFRKCSPEQLKLPAVLQKNPPSPTNSLVFQHLLHIWPLSNNDWWFWDPSFHSEENWRTQTQLV